MARMTPAVAPTATRALTTATMMAVRLLRFARSASDLKVADLEAVNLAAAGRADVRMPLGVAARAEDGGAGTGSSARNCRIGVHRGVADQLRLIAVRQPPCGVRGDGPRTVTELA